MVLEQVQSNAELIAKIISNCSSTQLFLQEKCGFCHASEGWHDNLAKLRALPEHIRLLCSFRHGFFHD